MFSFLWIHSLSSTTILLIDKLNFKEMYGLNKYFEYNCQIHWIHLVCGMTWHILQFLQKRNKPGIVFHLLITNLFNRLIIGFWFDRNFEVWIYKNNLFVYLYLYIKKEIYKSKNFTALYDVRNVHHANSIISNNDVCNECPKVHIIMLVTPPPPLAIMESFICMI